VLAEAEVVVRDINNNIITPKNTIIGDDLIARNGKTYSLRMLDTYTYIVTLAGYKDAEGTITVNGAKTENVALTILGGEYPSGWSRWRPSFGIYIMNRDGTTGTQLGNWNYNESAATYGTLNGEVFTESPLITNYSIPLVYSGIDNLPGVRLGVVKKAITPQSVINYFNSHNGKYVDISEDTYSQYTVKVATNSTAAENPYDSNKADKPPLPPKDYDWSGFFDQYTETVRSYYPDFVVGASSGDNLRSKNLGVGTPVPAVLAVSGYNERIARLQGDTTAPLVLQDGRIDNEAELQTAIEFLTGKADTERALRNFTGMLDTNIGNPLGSDDSYYVGSVWFMPTYRNIAVNGGSIVYTSDVQLDSYPRAAAGEVVTFLVGDTFQIDSVTIPDVTVNHIDGREYSFVMPDSAVAITITQPTPHNIAVNKSSNAVAVDVKVNGYTATSAIVGNNITFTVSPDDNYILNSVEVKNGENIISHTLTDGVYGFTMPDSAVTIIVTLTYTAPATKYAVTVSPPTGGAVTTDKNEAIHNDTVTLSVTPEYGKQLKSLKYNDTTITLTDGKYSFYMPESDVTVSAEFEDITYSVNIASGITGGTISASPSTAAEGATVTISVTPDDEYQLVSNSLKVNNKNH
jgi:hypothetical protein